MTPAVDTIKVAAFAVQGMTCASCVRRVEGALKRVPGVTEAQVNYATQRGTVRFSDGIVAYGRLVQAVEDAGYAVPGGHDAAQIQVAEPAIETLDLGILGMTCASCVRRVERARLGFASESRAPPSRLVPPPHGQRFSSARSARPGVEQTPA